MNKKNIVFQDYKIQPVDRAKMKNQKPTLIWFTGLSGSGKSTLANLLDKALYEKGFHTFTLDGDNIRSGLNKNLTFSAEDRTENIRRISEVANLILDAGIICIGAFISPYEKDRNNIKKVVGEKRYFEVFVDTPIEVCEERDIKGLYAKARAGEIKNFTGIDAPYEKPSNPAFRIDTSDITLEKALELLTSKIEPLLKAK